MKTLSLIVSVAALLVTAPATAQKATYACQFIQSAGMHKEPAGWKTTNFSLPEPFFFTMLDGLIDKKSLEKQPVLLSSVDAICSKAKYDNPLTGRTHWCAGSTNFFSFSEETLNGGLSKTMGALQSASDRIVDSVAVSRFKCQKVG